MISDGLEDRVRLFCDVAKVNGSLMSVSDLLELLPEGSEDEVERAIRLSPALSTTYELKSGFVVERSEDSAPSLEAASRARARTNLLHALGVAPLLKGPGVKLIGVSGSTSYKSASRSRDIDFFCVTDSGTMWIFLARALILSRLLRHLRAGGPEICLSCTMDSGYAERAFADSSGSLFARDALTMVVTTGGSFYKRLLERARWMGSFYPKLYSARMKGAGAPDAGSPEPNALQLVVNRFLYITVGTYIRTKAWLRNRSLVGRGSHDAAFTLIMGEDRCLYESTRYSKMRMMYDALRAE